MTAKLAYWWRRYPFNFYRIAEGLLIQGWTWLMKPFQPFRKFFKSLWTYLILYRHGFEITKSSDDEAGFELDIYRFCWNGRILKDFPDIDEVDGHFIVVQNGQHERVY